MFFIIVVCIAIGEVMLAYGVDRSYVQWLFGAHGIYVSLFAPLGFVGLWTFFRLSRYFDLEGE